MRGERTRSWPEDDGLSLQEPTSSVLWSPGSPGDLDSRHAGPRPGQMTDLC